MEPRSPNRARLILKLKDDKTFKTTVTLLLAGLTIVTSLIVIFNVQASSRGSAASRDSRILGLRYITQVNRAQWAYAAEMDILSFYQELTGLMLQAGAYTMGPGARDVVYYNLTRERLDKLRAVLAAEGELTRPPYSDSKAPGSGIFQYILDRMLVPAAETLERQEQRKAEGGFWGSKADAYTAGLAVMAVAVFLLTLSLVLGGRIRFFMAGAGLLLIAAVISIASAAGSRTRTGPADESIRQYAHAYGQTVLAQMFFSMNGDTGAALAAAGAAEAEIDRVLAREPSYRSAIKIRSLLRSLEGETLFYAGRAEESRRELEKAAADLDTLLRTGPADAYLFWSRGYVEYLMGRQAACAHFIDQALRLLPEQGFALGAVKAVALLGAGKSEDARAALETAIEFAFRKPLASDANYFRVLIHNLERIQELQKVEGLPACIRRLKEAAVSLAVLKKTHPLEEQSEIAPPRFGDPVYDKWYRITGFQPLDRFPESKDRAHFLLDLKGMRSGQSIVRKVYLRRPGQPFWIEQALLGRSEHWEGASEVHNLVGDVEMLMPEAGQTLPSGNYRIEIYIEGNLKATSFFAIL